MKRTLFLISIAALLAGCQTTKTVDPDPSILRVGITPRSQPMAFKQNGQIMGIEADFARKLGHALNRQVVFVEVPWDKQIDFVEQNKTDIIMSNMTITKARSMRINFTQPYLQSGLSAAFRRGEHDPMGLLGSTIRNQTATVGFVEDTTAEFYSVQRFTRAKLREYKSADEAVAALKKGEINVFVADAPIIWSQYAMNERDLIAFPEVYNAEPIAWGIGRNNAALLEEVNALLKKWDEDGTSNKIIQNWIPSFQ